MAAWQKNLLKRIFHVTLGSGYFVTSGSSDDREADARQALKLSDACSVLLDVLENLVTAVFGEQLDVGRCSQSVSLQQVSTDLVIGGKAVGLIVIKNADGFGQRVVY